MELTMILESAYLQIRPGESNAFETAFKAAALIIQQSTGYMGHELHRCVEDPNLYLLLVKWRTVEDHTEGFRGSEAYHTWKQLLHHFYEPFPTVWHFEEVDLA